MTEQEIRAKALEAALAFANQTPLTWDDLSIMRQAEKFTTYIRVGGEIIPQERRP